MILSLGQACSYPMRGIYAKYESFVYSSAYAYSVPTGCFSLEQFTLASQLGLSDDGGEVGKTRRLCETAVIETHDEQPVLKSIWKPFPDVGITTYLVPPVEATPNWHIRAHRINTWRDIVTADGAFAICNEGKSDARSLAFYDADRNEGAMTKIIGNYDLNIPKGSSPGYEGSFAVSKGAVGIVALEYGGRSQRMAMLVNADPNSNLVESRTAIPTLQMTLKAGSRAWFVTGIYAKPPGNARDYLDGWKNRPVVPDWLMDEMEDG